MNVTFSSGIGGALRGHLPRFIVFPSFQILSDRKNILAVLVCVSHAVHALFYHKDSETAFLAFLCLQRGIRVRFCKRIVLNTRINE